MRTDENVEQKGSEVFKLFRAQNALINYLLVFGWYNRKIQDTQLG